MKIEMAAYGGGMDAVKISVVIPVYNVEAYLEACLQSVMQQTVVPYEVILVDDGSTDSSGAICDEYAEKMELIRVIHQKNAGLSAARNAGMAAAEGDYIMFLDSDDTIIPETCERFAKVLAEKDVDIAVGNFNVVRSGKTTIRKHFLCDSRNIMSGEQFLKTEIKEKTMFSPVQQGIYSRRFLMDKQLSFIPGLLHEDEVFMPSALIRAEKVLPTDIIFYNHMIRPNSITTKKNKIPNAESILKICDYLEDFVNSECVDEELKKMLLDHAIDLYYKVFIDAELIKHKEYRLSRAYLRRNSYSIKNQLRNTLYFFNEGLFALVEKKRRRV